MKMKNIESEKSARTSGSLTRRPFFTIGVTERSCIRDPNQGLLKKLRIVIGTKFVGMCTYEDGSGSSTDSPDS
jgi:hypothetical protein